MEQAHDNIRFFNTLTRKKEKFVPIKKSAVKMYTCGPTVWDFAHVGNFRTFLFEDLLRRWLIYRGYDITQVMNITDVDDRTISASQKQGIPLNRLTNHYIQAFFEDLKEVNAQRAEFYPRATEHISEIVTLIKRLLEKNFAYRGDDGSIYYDISTFKTYGQLSKFKATELKTGARVKLDEYAKEEARDFALWKAWDEADGNVFWETEIGKGRPGWHIECSAMSMKYLGETFDIHTGGVDNMFPHHENEIAQSEAATGKRFVNYWMHCEHLLVEGKRMGKRFGNYYTVRDLTKLGHDPMAIRYLLLSTHYRQQLNFTFEGLRAAQNAIDRLRNFMRRLSDVEGETSVEFEELAKNVEKDFGEALDDDLNMNAALTVLFEFVRQVNNLIDSEKLNRVQAEHAIGLMRRFDSVLGVMGDIAKQEALPTEVEELIRRREQARIAGNWKLADEIRAQLTQMGIILEDTHQGTRWKRGKNREN